jgi:hypothetical protein
MELVETRLGEDSSYIYCNNLGKKWWEPRAGRGGDAERLNISSHNSEDLLWGGSQVGDELAAAAGHALLNFDDGVNF